MSYMTRTAAVAAARKVGGTAFMTYFNMKTRAWYVKGVDLALPVEAKALETLPIVHHVEWTLRDGGKLTPCAVVTCAGDDAALGDIPEGVAIEPLDPSLWTSATPSPVRPKSEVTSPVKVVWDIAAKMVGASRAEVIAACVAAGVNKSTASTQYYKWGKANGKA